MLTAILVISIISLVIGIIPMVAILTYIILGVIEDDKKREQIEKQAKIAGRRNVNSDMFDNFGMVCRTAVMGVDNNYGYSKRALF